MVPILNDLLARSAEFERRLERALQAPPFDESDKVLSSRIMCGIASEHSESLMVLISAGNYTSATGLLRLQFESFVRGIWLLYVADSASAELLMSELSDELVVKAQKMPMLTVMLDELESKAPQHVLARLREFKQYSWKPLNSFVHGGIHAVNRHSKGYPVDLLIQVLKASNGLSVMVGMLMAALAGSQTEMTKVAAVGREFSDCLPMDDTAKV